MKYAIFDTNGLPTAFYAPEINGENIPEAAIELTDEQWQEFIWNSGLRRWTDGAVVEFTPPPPEIPPNYVIPKALPWRRMTEVEAEKVTAAMSQATARQRAIYDAAQYIDTTDELYSILSNLLSASLSPSRAAELLARE